MSYLDDTFLNRVKCSYKSALAKFDNAGSIWPIIDALRAPVHDALMEENNATLRRIFENPLISDLFFGMDSLALTVEARFEVGSNVDEYFANYSSNLLSLLGAALGVKRYVPPGCEQFDYYHTRPYAETNIGPEDQIASIEEYLAIKLDFPTPFPGERGLLTSRGLAGVRSISAVYQAARVRQELATVSNQSVLEIGPGMGRTAYYATKLGIPGYATIDLPLGVVAQACFLGATLGPDSIWMIADKHPPGKRIRLYPSTELKILDNQFGLVLNVDSITEMGRVAAEQYMSWIATHAEVFLSINQEANEPTIPQLLRDIMPGAYCFRAPYWMRLGYQEELIRLPAGHRDRSLLRRLVRLFARPSE